MSSWGGTEVFSVWYLISLITLGSPSKLEEEGEEGLRGEEGLTLVTLVCDKAIYLQVICWESMEEEDGVEEEEDGVEEEEDGVEEEEEEGGL